MADTRKRLWSCVGLIMVPSFAFVIIGDGDNNDLVVEKPEEER